MSGKKDDAAQLTIGTGATAVTVALDHVERASLTGGDSSNTIDASDFTGDVVLHGGAGKDTLSGGSGDDQLFGEAGDDILRGGAGNDRLYGGDGNDTYVFVLSSESSLSVAFGEDELKELAGEGKDKIEFRGSSANLSINGLATILKRGADSITQVLTDGGQKVETVDLEPMGDPVARLVALLSEIETYLGKLQGGTEQLAQLVSNVPFLVGIGGKLRDLLGADRVLRQDSQHRRRRYAGRREVLALRSDNHTEFEAGIAHRFLLRQGGIQRSQLQAHADQHRCRR